MSLPPITGLSADIVPHSQWATRKWFYADPLWYYHRPGTNEEIVANRKFYQLVDAELKPLCHLLNDHGFHTTPSCQGHFYRRGRFERIWEQLRREAGLIGGGGLVVKDSETGRRFRFCQEGYALPWDNIEAFCELAAEHQGTGYLGIVVPEARSNFIAGLCGISGRRDIVSMGFDEQSSEMLNGRLFNILVRPSTDAERTLAWARLTRLFRDLLEKESPAPADFRRAASCDAAPRVWSA